MSVEDDPPRFASASSGPEAALGALFREAQRDLPAPAELERLSMNLATALGPAVALRDGKPMLRAMGIGGGIAGVALIAWLLWPASEVRPSESPAAEPRAAAAPPLALPAAPAAPSVTSTVSHPSPASPAPVVTAKPAERARAAAAPSAGRAASEAALLESARAALATNPSRALSLTREHARRFPRGVLAQEREVIAIEALRRAGQSSAAEQRARDFKQEYPGSPHRRTIDTKAR